MEWHCNKHNWEILAKIYLRMYCWKLAKRRDALLIIKRSENAISIALIAESKSWSSSYLMRIPVPHVWEWKFSRWSTNVSVLRKWIKGSKILQDFFKAHTDELSSDEEFLCMSYIIRNILLFGRCPILWKMYLLHEYPFLNNNEVCSSSQGQGQEAASR